MVASDRPVALERAALLMPSSSRRFLIKLDSLVCIWPSCFLFKLITVKFLFDYLIIGCRSHYGFSLFHNSSFAACISSAVAIELLCTSFLLPGGACHTMAS